jgi:hypothetical protein
MKKLTFFLSILVSLVGCAGGIDSVDTSKKNGACVRQCSGTYSSCIGNAFGLSAQSACASGFKACANTCPDK